MLKARTLLILGIWVALLPYLGFPYTIKNILFSLTGLALIYVSLVIYKEARRAAGPKVAVFENFSENREFLEEDKESQLI